MCWSLLAAVACTLPRFDRDPAGGGGDDDTRDTSSVDADNDGYDAGVDCDDDEPSVHPGTKEWCGNGIDDNCNGTSDGCDWSGVSELAGTTISGDDDDYVGFALAVCDTNGDGQADVITSAYGPNGFAGAVYSFYGPIEDTMTVASADSTVEGTAAGVFAGSSIDCRGDVEGDSAADLLVGEPGDAWGAFSGAVHIVPGGGTGIGSIVDEATSIWTGEYAGDRLGHEVRAIQLDDDAFDEVIATAVGTPGNRTQYGMAYVIGSPTGDTRSIDGASAYVYGTEADIVSATAGNAGDLDGDGLEELALAGYGAAYAAVFVFHPPLAGALSLSDADVRINDTAFGLAYTGLAHADLDQDGHDDLLVGNPYAASIGVTYVFYGEIVGDTTTAEADVRIMGGNEGFQQSGSAIASPGDLDGDGKGEILIGAEQGGGLYLHYGGDEGTYNLREDARAAWSGTWPYAYAPLSLETGELTGDGVVDFAIGASWAGDDYQGAVVVMPSFDL